MRTTLILILIAIPALGATIHVPADQLMGSFSDGYRISEVAITYPQSDECLCGEVTFTAEVTGNPPDVDQVCFYFDGEDVPRFCDDNPPYEWIVNVNDAFEPETHVIMAEATLTDESQVWSESVIWSKSCDPYAVLQMLSIDHCNRMVTVSAALSSDDNVEPGLTYEFDSATCVDNWTHDQSAPGDATVTFSFDTDECGYGDYEISVTVFDGWCEGSDTETISVTFVDNCLGVLAFTDPTAVGVYGDSENTWPLAATATDRLVDPEITAVDFYFDIDATVPPTDPDFGMLCSATDQGGNIWGCDFDSTDLPAVGGYYYFHVMSTDNAENSQWATPQMFWKSDMPAGMNLTEEHADGNYYDNGFASLPFTLTFTDDNLADDVTTYEVNWTFSDGSSYMTTVGTTDAGTSAITHTFPAFGTYTLCAWIKEVTPQGFEIYTFTECWAVILADGINITAPEDPGVGGEPEHICGSYSFEAEDTFPGNYPAVIAVDFYIDGEFQFRDEYGGDGWTFFTEVNGWDEGLHNVQVLANHSSGGESWSSTVPFVVDCTPTILQRMSASSNPDGTVSITWEAERTSDDSEFILSGSRDEIEWTVSFEEVQRNIFEAVDRSEILLQGGEYSYSLFLREGEEPPLLLGEESLQLDPTALASQLLGVFPNPSNPRTTIVFQLNRRQRVRVSIHDLEGRQILVLEDTEFERGRNELTWDGQDSHGRSTSSGIYFVHMEAAGFHDSRKIVLLR